MARLPRFAPTGIPQHVIQRGNNRQACFCDNSDFATYAKYLKTAAEKYLVEIHAWCFMTNHVHLLATPNNEGGISSMMQSLGRQYVRYFNKKYSRSGTLWEGRFKACLVDSENYLLTCYQYIELNPVRANLVDTPQAYSWSSHGVNIGEKSSSMCMPHETYLALGKNAEDRYKNYQSLFSESLSEHKLEAIRYATHRGLVVGSEEFKAKIESIIGESVYPNPVGRPANIGEPVGVYFV